MLGKAIWVVVGVVLSVGGANAAPRSPRCNFWPEFDRITGAAP
jgi:hypothetical protein